jgi:serine/threonine protein phosphatase PrpC
MSTYRSIGYMSRSIGSVVFALLGGMLVALQFVLPAAAFAASTATAAPSPSNDPAFERAQVSVVRLMVTYNPPSSATASLLPANSFSTPTTSPEKSANPIQCTGLGILVGSWAANSKDVNSPFINWVLTDGVLVSPNGPGCAQNSTQRFVLSRIDVLANDVYTQKMPTLQTLGSVQCNGTTSTCRSENVQSSFLPPVGSSPTNSAMLFSFLSDLNSPQPFVNIANPKSSAQVLAPQDALQLTDGNNHLPPPALNSTNNLPSNYLVPEAVLLNSNKITTSTPPTSSTPIQEEPGTPTVNAAGDVVSIQSGGGPVSLAQAYTLLQQQQLKTPHTNPLQKAWDAGIAALFATSPEDTTAAREFGLASNANSAFHAGTFFRAMALGTNGTATPFPTRPAQPTPAQTSRLPFGSSIPLIPIAAGALALIILIILLGVLLRGRRRRRELAQFEAERQAAALQVQQQPLPATPPAMMNQVSGPLPPQNVLPCPHCQQPVRLDAPFCYNCHYLLSMSPSGHLQAAPPAPSEGPTTPLLPTVPKPLSPEEVSISERTTMRISADETAKKIPYSVEKMMGHNLSLAVGTRTDPGIKRKYKPNEDSVFAAQGARPQKAQLQQFGLFVVADGMGGHANGQDASRLAIQTIINFMVPKLSEGKDMQDAEFLKLLAEGVQQANMAVYKQNQEQRGDMGTTMTAALVIGSMAFVANVGDSRTYLYREPEGLVKVTKDHSVVASLVDAGVIKPDDIYTHPKRNQIYRSLGEKSVVEVDTFTVPLKPGDKLLLCSDGLWDMVRDPEIQRVMHTPVPDPSQTGEALIKAALDGGGDDNVSVIVVNIGEASQQNGVAGIQLLAKPDSVSVPNMP